MTVLPLSEFPCQKDQLWYCRRATRSSYSGNAIYFDKFKKIFLICLPSTKQNRLSPFKKKKGFSNWLINLWTLNERKITKTLSYVVKFGYAVLTHGHILSCLIGLSEYRDTLHIDQLPCRGTRTEMCLDWPVCQHTGTHFVKYWLSCHHKGNISALTGCGV